MQIMQVMLIFFRDIDLAIDIKSNSAEPPSGLKASFAS